MTRRIRSAWLPVSCNDPDAGTSSLARSRSSSPLSIMTTDHKPACAGRPPGLARHAGQFSQQVSVGKCRYSVPARLIDSRVRVALSANELHVFDGSRLAAVHPRLTAAGTEHLELDHYLEILIRKPGALAGSAALAQARAAGVFTSVHEAFWAAARARHGDGAGTKALIEVLLLHRRMPAAQVIAGMQAALTAGACSAGVVAVEARKHAAAAPGGTGDDARRALLRPTRSRAAVVTLPRRAGELPADRRPAPSVAAYDQLLPVPPASHGGA
jgi:hypothetical protein